MGTGTEDPQKRQSQLLGNVDPAFGITEQQAQRDADKKRQSGMAENFSAPVLRDAHNIMEWTKDLRSYDEAAQTFQRLRKNQDFTVASESTDPTTGVRTIIYDDPTPGRTGNPDYQIIYEVGADGMILNIIPGASATALIPPIKRENGFEVIRIENGAAIEHVARNEQGDIEPRFKFEKSIIHSEIKEEPQQLEETEQLTQQAHKPLSPEQQKIKYFVDRVTPNHEGKSPSGVLPDTWIPVITGGQGFILQIFGEQIGGNTPTLTLSEEDLDRTVDTVFQAMMDGFSDVKREVLFTDEARTAEIKEHLKEGLRATFDEAAKLYMDDDRSLGKVHRIVQSIMSNLSDAKKEMQFSDPNMKETLRKHLKETLDPQHHTAIDFYMDQLKSHDKITLTYEDLQPEERVALLFGSADKMPLTPFLASKGQDIPEIESSTGRMLQAYALMEASPKTPAREMDGKVWDKNTIKRERQYRYKRFCENKISKKELPELQKDKDFDPAFHILGLKGMRANDIITDIIRDLDPELFQKGEDVREQIFNHVFQEVVNIAMDDPEKLADKAFVKDLKRNVIDDVQAIANEQEPTLHPRLEEKAVDEAYSTLLRDPSPDNIRAYSYAWEKEFETILSDKNLSNLDNPTPEQRKAIQQYQDALTKLEKHDKQLRRKGEAYIKAADQAMTNIIPSTKNHSISPQKVGRAAEMLDEKEIAQLSKKPDNKLGISPWEQKAMEYMTLAKEGTPLNDAQREHVHNFMEHAYGNMDLNRRMKSLTKNELPKEVSSQIGLVMAITYKTKNTDNIVDINNRFQAVYNTLNEPEKNEPENKITHNEFGILRKVQALKKELEKLNEMGFIKPEGKMNNLYQISKQVQEPLKNVTSKMLKERANDPSHLYTFNIRKQKDLLQQVPTVEEKIEIAVMGDHGHMGTVQESKEDKVKHAHLGSVTMQSSLGEKDILISDFYEVDLKNLLKPEAYQKAQEKYGENCAKELMKLYRKAEDKVHTKMQKSKVTNSDERQRDAGIRSLAPFGNTRLTERDLDKTHRKIMEGHYETGSHEMICSEYTIKAFVATAIEFENDLKQEIPALESEKRLTNLDSLKHERFKNMLPERVVQVLSKAGIIKQKEATPTEQKLFTDKVKPTSKPGDKDHGGHHTR